MANKLKKVFSDEKVAISGKIHFQDRESYDKFQEALREVRKEGKKVKLEGITSVETSVKDGDSIYPVREQGDIVDFVVAPSVESVTFDLDTEFGKRELVFQRYYTNRDIILETSEQAVVYLKMVIEKGTMKNTFTYRAQPKLAKSVREVVENYGIASAFLERLFPERLEGTEEDYSSEESAFIQNMKEYFAKAGSFYKKLGFVEQEFGVIFHPAELTQDEESQMDLEELYLLLREKKVIRLNARLTETEATGITFHQTPEKVKPGSVLDITFINSAEYSLWGQQVTLYTASLLSNAIVKEIRKLPDGETNIHYGEEDSRPMYISYRGFKTEAEAEEEMKSLMKHKSLYAEALTVNEYLSQSGK